MKSILRSLLLFGLWKITVDGYPMIVEVDEEEQRVSLFNLSITLGISATCHMLI